MWRTILTSIVACILLGSTLGLAQPPAPRVQWTHDGVNVTRFEIVIDAVDTTDVGLPTPVGTTYTAPLPALTDGVHTLVVQACNTGGCTPSAALTVVKMEPLVAGTYPDPRSSDRATRSAGRGAPGAAWRQTMRKSGARLRAAFDGWTVGVSE